MKRNFSEMCGGIAAEDLNGWICTDPANAKFTKKLNDFKFSFLEVRQENWLGEDWDVVCYAVVDLQKQNFSFGDLWTYLRDRYESFEQTVFRYGVCDALHVMAEYVFDATDLEDMNLACQMKSSWEDTERYLRICLKRF